MTRYSRGDLALASAGWRFCFFYLELADNHKTLPRSGKTSDVGGIFSATNIMNTVIDSSVVIPIVTFSPESDGT